jgi:hypothetical protein
MTIYEDPFGWMRPIYSRLRDDARLSMLAPAHQFALLVEAVEQEQPTRAAELRQYSSEAQQGLLAHLGSVASQAHESETIELWRATKNDRVLTCVARYLPTGVDVLVFQNGELRRSQLCPTGPDARTLAALWKSALEKSGWS